MSQPIPNPNNNENPVLAFYQQWRERTPFVTRNLMITVLVCYILSWFLISSQMLGDIPYFTIFQFEIYRLITSPIVGNSILDVVIIALFFPQMGTQLENSYGSGSFLALNGILTLVINITFIIITLVLFLVGMPVALFYSCSGFWTIIFALMTIQCWQTPDAPRRLLFCPFDIPSKYMPALMYFMFCLFSGPILSYAVSIVIGYLYSQGYLDRLKLSSYYLESLEQPNGIFHSISRSPGWVLAGAALGHDAWLPVNNPQASAAGGWGQGGQQQGQGQGGQQPGGGGGGGFAMPGTTSDGLGGSGGKKDEKNPFPGSGHKLTTGSATSTATSALSSFASNFSFGSSSASSASATAGSGAGAGGAPTLTERERQNIAQRRLAALSSSNTTAATGTTTSAAVAPSAPPAPPALATSATTAVTATRSDSSSGVPPEESTHGESLETDRLMGGGVGLSAAASAAAASAAAAVPWAAAAVSVSVSSQNRDGTPTRRGRAAH